MEQSNIKVGDPVIVLGFTINDRHYNEVRGTYNGRIRDKHKVIINTVTVILEEGRFRALRKDELSYEY